MQRSRTSVAATVSHTPLYRLRPIQSIAQRTYAGIKQDDPSLHPTGANSEAAKDLGPLQNSTPPPMSKLSDNSPTSKSTEATESNAAAKEEHQRHQSQDPQVDETPSSARKTSETIAQMDEDLRQRMAGHIDEGGEAGVEYEDGVPVAMKRGVRNNMFRYI